jgi:hypothetical protein
METNKPNSNNEIVGAAHMWTGKTVIAKGVIWSASLALMIGLGLAACGGGGGGTTGGVSGGAPAAPVVPPAPPLASTCTATAGGLTLSAGASRDTGVGPLAVFFDATATTHSNTLINPFHDIEYRWSFGDPGSGNWATGSRPGSTRNSATGPVAAHVYEPALGAGTQTFTINIAAFDGTNTATCQIQITVDDPNAIFAGAATICVSATGVPLPGDCPVAGATLVQQADFPTIISTLALAGRRVLLKGGDVFTGAATAVITNAGPGILGAYGVGKPILRTTAVANFSTILRLAGSGNDWRLVDLEFDGQSNIARQAINIDGSFSRLTMLRLNIHDIGGAIESALQSAISPGHDQIALVDSTIQRLNGGSPNSNSHGILSAASRLSILGNLFDDSTAGNAEHMIRLQFVNLGIVGNNTIQQVKVGKEMLALRAPCSSACPTGSGEHFPGLGLDGVAATTQKVVLSDNFIKTNTFGGIKVGPVNPNDSTLIRDVLIERNYYQNVSGGGVAIAINGSEVTIRNELMDVTDNSSLLGHTGIAIAGATAGMAASSNIRIYNNTIFSNSTGEFFGARFSAGTSGIIARNNIGYAPNATTTIQMFSDNATGTVLSNNSSNLQVSTVGPFVNGSGLFNSTTDFALLGGSYPLNAGAPNVGVGSVPVFSDFFRVIRPQGAGVDMGATEQ